MTALMLKIIACTAMLIDHSGLLFFPDEPIFRQIGRIALPLFAFMIAEGFTKTRSVPAYAKRMLTMGLISQLPFSAMEYLAGYSPWELNIMFLLAGGLGMLYALKRWRHWAARISIVAVCLLAAELAPVDYGAYGLVLILCSYIFLHKRALGLGTFIAAIYGRAIAIPALAYIHTFGLASLPFIWLYNGKQGSKRYKWWFYWFYPVHIAVLALVAYIF